MGALRVGLLDGEFIANPTHAQQDECDLEMVVCGTADSIVSVEGGAHEISEQDLVDTLAFAHEQIRELVGLQEKLIAEVGKDKLEFAVEEVDPELVNAVADAA